MIIDELFLISDHIFMHNHTSFSCWMVPHLLLISDYIFLHDNP